MPSESHDSGRGSNGLRAPALTAIVLVALLGGIGLSVVVVAGLAGVVRGAASGLAAAKVPTSGHATVTESMDLITSRSFGPMFTHPSWSVRAGETVILRIRSYDDGSAPLMGAQMMFDGVRGTLGGTETVQGRTISSVPNEDVAHTFTVPGLGVNLPIPVAPTGGSVMVVARFVATRTGTFVWQCYAPCGSGMNGMGGAMSTQRWMEGTVKVVP
ncbi:MAG: cupredoxin domain-containing protein [Acidimicrobiales bacterium]